MTKQMTFVAVALLLGVSAFSQLDTGIQTRLEKERPRVQWNAASATKVDLDCDGKPDTFVWGIDEQVTRTFVIQGKTKRQIRREVVLALKRASAVKLQFENIPFIRDTGYYGFCALPKTIEVRPLSCEWETGVLPGCKQNNRCEALWVRDGECGEFFVFWDSTRQAMTWVRH